MASTPIARSAPNSSGGSGPTAVRRGGFLLAVSCGYLLAVSYGATVLSGQEPTDSLREVALPEPWGPYAIGVHTLVVEDSSRSVRGPDGEPAPRPVLVRVWHPAAPTLRPPRPYMDARTSDAWRSTLPVPAGFEARVHTHAVPEADWPEESPADGWPVLLFSHGRSFPVENYQILLEQLASMGWAVAALSHAGEEALTVLPDGRAFPFSGPSWDRPEDRGDVLMPVVDALVADANRVLDVLEAAVGASDGPLAGRLSMHRGVGYFGHSLGGATAAWALQRDPRVRAAASWEGQIYRDEDRPMRAAGPLLYILGGFNRRELSWKHFRAGDTAAPVYQAVIEGAWHASVGDLIHIYRTYAPRDWHERHRTEITAERANQITVDLLDAFFGAHLLGRPADLLRPDTAEEQEAGATLKYPEVSLTVHAGTPAPHADERPD